MPEEIEVDTEKLHEAIKEELEHERSSFLKMISLTTAILAVLAAIASLKAGDTVNEALVLKTEAARLQSEASDYWAYYQAKGLKAAIQEASKTSWLAIGKLPPAKYEQKKNRYLDEQGGIQKKALGKEHERDEKLKESDQLLQLHHGFAGSVALFQVSIALGAVAALTRFRPVWFGSMLLGAVGIIIFSMTLFH